MEQLIREHEAVKRQEPSLVTTLHPYNYEIDLPFKQNSSHLVNNVRQKQAAQQPSMMALGKMNEHPKDYATFSIQDVKRAEDYHSVEQEDHQKQLMQRVFSSSTTSHDDGDTAHLSTIGQRRPAAGERQNHQYSQQHQF